MSSSEPQPQTQPEDHRAISIPLPQAARLLTSFAHFFTVSIHNILYHRSLYPQTTFLSTQAYNLAVHQSRHPAVCAWVRDAVDAVKAQLVKGTVSRIAIVIHGRDTQVRERWMLDVGSFPAWPEFDEVQSLCGAGEDAAEGKGKEKEGPQQEDGEAEEDAEPEHAEAQRGETAVNWSDVDEGLRAALWKMALVSEKMAPLPDGCSFTIALELREASEAPIGVSTCLGLANTHLVCRDLRSQPCLQYPQHWIPSQSRSQSQSGKRREGGRFVDSAKTIPVRTVEAGPLFFECWVEEGEDAKLVANASAQVPS